MISRFNLKKPLVIALGVLVAAIAIFLVFFSIPSNYKNNVSVRTTRITGNHGNENPSRNLTRIGVFSDLMIGFDYQVENLPTLVNTINNANLDIIVFNGGLLYNNYELTNEQRATMVELLSSIRVPFGKFAVASSDDTSVSDSILFDSGFEMLENQSRPINLNGNQLTITGLLNQNFNDVLSSLNPDMINLAFIHDPTNNQQLLAYNTNVIVSAKTFGGQYNIPLFGSIYEDLREFPFYRGISHIDNQIVIANNGIGINRGSMRFLAPSTLDVIVIE